MQNNLEKEKKFNEERIKYEEEIKVLKDKNDEVKKENEILKKDYEKKMNDVKLANEASNKLKNTLEEIKKMTPP